MGGGGGAEWEVGFPIVLLPWSSSVGPWGQGCLLLILPLLHCFRQTFPQDLPLLPGDGGSIDIQDAAALLLSCTRISFLSEFWSGKLR